MWIVVPVRDGFFPVYSDSSTAAPPDPIPQPGVVSRLPLTLVIWAYQFGSLDPGHCQKLCSPFLPLQSLLLDWADVPEGEGAPKCQAYLSVVVCFQFLELKIVYSLVSCSVP